MRAVVMNRYGGNEVLDLRDVTMPTVGAHDVLVAVAAASVNPIDFKIRDGKLRLMRLFPLPIVIVNDLAGRVVATATCCQAFRGKH